MMQMTKHMRVSLRVECQYHRACIAETKYVHQTVCPVIR